MAARGIDVVYVLRYVVCFRFRSQSVLGMNIVRRAGTWTCPYENGHRSGVMKMLVFFLLCATVGSPDSACIQPPNSIQKQNEQSYSSLTQRFQNFFCIGPASVCHADFCKLDFTIFTDHERGRICGLTFGIPPQIVGIREFVIWID